MVLKRHHKQKQFLQSPKPYVLLRGGRGSGKTHAGAMFACEQLARYPNVLGLIGANTFSQLYKFTVAKLMMLLDQLGIEYVIGRKPPEQWPSHRTLKDYDGVLTLCNGGQALLVSLERYDTAARGGDLGWAWLDETRDTAPQAIDVVLGAFRGFGGKHPGWVYKLRITTTPNGFDHVWERFASGGERQLPDSEDIHCHTRDNVFEEGFADRLLGAYSMRMAQQEVEGNYVNLSAGRAFEFDRGRNVADVKYNPLLPLMFSMDFNVAPLCGIVLQIDKAQKMVNVLDEIHLPDNGQTREACNVFNDRWHGKVNQVISDYNAVPGRLPKDKLPAPFIWFHGDAAGKHRDTRENVSDIAIMQQTLKARWGLAKEHSDGRKGRVKDGINAVNALLNPAVGKPRLLVNPACLVLIRDLEQVNFKPGTTDIEKDDDLLTHMADALRYPIAQEFPVSAMTISTANGHQPTAPPPRLKDMMQVSR